MAAHSSPPVRAAPATLVLPLLPHSCPPPALRRGPRPPAAQLGHQAAQCTVGTVNWKQLYGEDVFKLKKASLERPLSPGSEQAAPAAAPCGGAYIAVAAAGFAPKVVRSTPSFSWLRGQRYRRLTWERPPLDATQGAPSAPALLPPYNGGGCRRSSSRTLTL